MKYRFFYRFLLITLAASQLVAQGCTEIIDIEVDSTYVRCVIYGEITTDTLAHRVTVSRSGEYFANMPAQGISGAEVTITDGELVFPLTEDPLQPGTYYTDPGVYGVPGRTYTLNVRNVNLLGDGVMHSYQASSHMLPIAAADSIAVEYRFLWQGWVVKAYATDPAQTRDFYMFHVFINGEIHSDTLRTLTVTNDLLFNGNSTNGIEIYYIRGLESLTPGDSVTAYFCGITEDYYMFIVEAQTAARRSTPMFSGPPANPRTNLSNDAIGFFTAYSISKASTIVPIPQVSF